MTCTKEELKRRIEAAPVASNGRVQFPPDLRRDVMEHAKEQQAAGRSQNDIAAELGMNAWTLNRWNQNERKAKAGAASFVEVTPKKRGRPPQTSQAGGVPEFGFEVTCPSGFEVRVPARFEPRALRDLLAALEGR